MRRGYRILPVYSGDVSGAAAALFELGGMTVMHDPSGCNSTYNTHDETRWYDQDSLIFITGLTDQDAIMGNDDKLIHDIEKAAEEFRPKFVAIVNSPIPYLNGTDFEAISSIIEEDTGIPTFYVPTNGNHDYVQGAGLALREIARRFVDTAARPDGTGRINLLGCTPLDFPADGETASLQAVLKNGGFEIISTWAMGDALDTLRRAGEADVNLVVSAVGMPTAKYLKETFGTPYVAAVPLPGYEESVFSALRRAMSSGEDQIPYQKREDGKGALHVFIGDPVFMGTRAALAAREQNVPTRMLCPLEADPDLLGPKDAMTRGEVEVEEEFAHAGKVIADPLYRYICPETAQFSSDIHFGFSGRMFRKQFTDRFRKNDNEKDRREELWD